MPQRTFTTKSGTTFEWEETPEVLEALKNLHEVQSQTNKESDS